jgi:hypothetical protein
VSFSNFWNIRWRTKRRSPVIPILHCKTSKAVQMVWRWRFWYMFTCAFIFNGVIIMSTTSEDSGACNKFGYNCEQSCWWSFMCTPWNVRENICKNSRLFIVRIPSWDYLCFKSVKSVGICLPVLL